VPDADWANADAVVSISINPMAGRQGRQTGVNIFGVLNIFLVILLSEWIQINRAAARPPECP
jgi:hypothetical protein